MPGWFSRAAARASRSTRSPPPFSSGIALTATSRSSFSSQASHTTPNPPAPSRRSSRYRPSISRGPGAPGSASVGSEPPSGRVPGSSVRLISGRFISGSVFGPQGARPAPRSYSHSTLAGASRRQGGESSVVLPRRTGRARSPTPPRTPRGVGGPPDADGAERRRGRRCPDRRDPARLAVPRLPGRAQGERHGGLRQPVGGAHARVEAGGRPAVRAAAERGGHGPGGGDPQRPQRLPRLVERTGRPRARTRRPRRAGGRQPLLPRRPRAAPRRPRAHGRRDDDRARRPGPP